MAFQTLILQQIQRVSMHWQKHASVLQSVMYVVATKEYQLI